MSYPLRLPKDLDTAARERSAGIGISLNALVCVALDAYLRCGAVPQPQPSKPVSTKRRGGRPVEETIEQLHARARAVGQDPEHAEFLDPEDFKLLTGGKDPTDDEFERWMETGELPAGMQSSKPRKRKPKA